MFQDLIVQPVRDALEYYRRLNEAAKDERHHRKSVIDLGESTLSSAPSSTTSVIKSTSSHSMRSKRSGGTIRSRSRSIEDEAENNLLEEDPENPESSDPETATEVEVSEKTLKFKISTESGGPPQSGRKSYPGSRKGSREKSSFDYHHHDLAKAVRDHERERKKSRGENLSSDMSSPVSARSGEDTRILEELEKDEVMYIEARIEEETTENNGAIIESIPERNNSKKRPSLEDRKDLAMTENLRCNCEDKTTSNNHKSLLSRLRNFTDRLSISFDSKEPPPKTKHVSKPFIKSNSVVPGSTSRQPVLLCKRCNLTKTVKDTTPKDSNQTVVELLEKRAMTLPKVKKHEGKNKSWRMVFAKEKRPSASLEVLPAHDSDTSVVKHKRNLSNPESKLSVTKTLSMREVKDVRGQKRLNFDEIDVRSKPKPEIVVHPGSSNIVDEGIEKVEIRRSSASMEDISKITKQNEGVLLGNLEDKKCEEMHTGSLDSMLYKESVKDVKKTFAFASPVCAKKASPGLFSRFRSGMSIDGTRSTSNSGSLHDQPTQSGWISSLTASLRPKRQIVGEMPASPGHEEVK